MEQEAAGKKIEKGKALPKTSPRLFSYTWQIKDSENNESSVSDFDLKLYKKDMLDNPGCSLCWCKLHAFMFPVRKLQASLVSSQ